MFFLVFCSTSFANQTTGAISGVVTKIVGAHAPIGVSVGDPVLSSFSYGAASSSGTDLVGWQYNFENTDFALVVRIGSLKWGSIAEKGLVILRKGFLGDSYSVGSNNIADANFPGHVDPSGLYQNLLSIGVSDNSAPYELIDSFQLPRSANDLHLQSATNMGGHIGLAGPPTLPGDPPASTWSIEYRIDTFVLSPVPEPSTAAQLMLALLLLPVDRLLCQFRRRRHAGD